MTRGSCLCQGVAWEADGPFPWMSNCHCSRCRKKHGAAFATYLGARPETFRWLRGQELVATFEGRPFCTRCSSVTPPPSAASGEADLFLAAGCLDDDPDCRASSHNFVGSKARWFEVPDDGIERFEAFPDLAAPELTERPALPATTGGAAIRGSCLCGDTVFELTRPRALVFCHCMRCRKGRSAAFASNLFADADGFRYLRGEEQLRAYKVPEALRFGITFCGHCGSGMPRPPIGSPMAVVPAGVLDDDLPAVPAMHIFVGSKAPWHEIHDDLPQALEYRDGAPSMFEWIERNL